MEEEWVVGGWNVGGMWVVPKVSQGRQVFGCELAY